MPSTRRHSYDLNFKLKIVAEAIKQLTTIGKFARVWNFRINGTQMAKPTAYAVYWRAKDDC